MYNVLNYKGMCVSFSAEDLRDESYQHGEWQETQTRRS